MAGLATVLFNSLCIMKTLVKRREKTFLVFSSQYRGGEDIDSVLYLKLLSQKVLADMSRHTHSAAAANSIKMQMQAFIRGLDSKQI